MNYSVVIPCAGIGSRMKLGYNKMLYIMNNNKTVIENTVDIFINDYKCNEIVLVINKEDYALINKIFQDKEKIKFALGGQTRQESVFHGLLQVTNEYVLIHDGARCYLKNTSINRLLDCLSTEEACLLMISIKDTIKKVSNGIVVRTLDRDILKAAQTPQAFKTELILKAHQMANTDDILVNDDASLIEHYDLCHVLAIEGDYGNIKVTTLEDIRDI